MRLLPAFEGGAGMPRPVREASHRIRYRIAMLQYRILETQVAYTGRELRPGWVAARSGLRGDVAVGFVGPCHVANEDLVDLEDREAGTHIEAAWMAHIIAEHTDAGPSGLGATVLRQRLLVCLLCDALRERGVQ